MAVKPPSEENEEKIVELRNKNIRKTSKKTIDKVANLTYGMVKKT